MGVSRPSVSDELPGCGQNGTTGGIYELSSEEPLKITELNIGLQQAVFGPPASNNFWMAYELEANTMRTS